jgi:hypothetical protein
VKKQGPVVLSWASKMEEKITSWWFFHREEI